MKKAISKQTMMLGTEQKNKKLQSFRVSGKFLIPKSYFLDFMVSESSFDIKRKTNKHISLVRSFLENSAKK